MLDKLTKADGNCFFRGILQQCGRQEVYLNLPDEVKVMVDSMNHLGLREWIRNCVFNSNHLGVQRDTLEPFLPMPWTNFLDSHDEKWYLGRTCCSGLYCMVS